MFHFFASGTSVDAVWRVQHELYDFLRTSALTIVLNGYECFVVERQYLRDPREKLFGIVQLGDDVLVRYIVLVLMCESNMPYLTTYTSRAIFKGKVTDIHCLIHSKLSISSTFAIKVPQIKTSILNDALSCKGLLI